MAVAETAVAIAAERGGQGAADDGVVRVIDACVLAPIQGLRPAGEDIRGLKLWVDLRTARPKADDPTADDSWQRANAVATDWPSYGALVQAALCTRSKDLELGLFLTEARTRTDGFAGARDGFWMLRKLIEDFADRGLFPLADDGDLETQYGPLHWLNGRFPEVLHELELTRSPEGPNYSLNYRIEAFNPRGGMITVAQWDSSATAGSSADYAELLGLIEAAQAELGLLKRVVSGRYGSDALSFAATEETLGSCRDVVSGFLRRLESKGGRQAQDTHARPLTTPQLATDRDQLNAEYAADGRGSGAWTECERLVRAGQVDQALREMTALAAGEPNGRIRFQRKLLLADLCLQTNRKKLGASILEELNEIIEQHKLETWRRVK